MYLYIQVVTIAIWYIHITNWKEETLSLPKQCFFALLGWRFEWVGSCDSVYIMSWEEETLVSQHFSFSGMEWDKNHSWWFILMEITDIVTMATTTWTSHANHEIMDIMSCHVYESIHHTNEKSDPHNEYLQRIVPCWHCQYTFVLVLMRCEVSVLISRGKKAEFNCQSVFPEVWVG